MKATTSLTIDADILSLAKEKYPGKLSQMFNDFLKNVLINDEKPGSKEQLEQELSEIEAKNEVILSKKRVLMTKLTDFDQELSEIEAKKVEKREEKALNDEIKEELKEPLTLREIEFFNNLNPKSKDVFNMNYYNNTFYRQFNEKQYLKRFKKFNDEIKPLPRL